MPISTINSNSIGNGTVIAADILDGTISSSKLVSANIAGDRIAANTLSNTVFQTGSVESYLRSQTLDFGMRNRIINGAMRIDQRNAGASVTFNDNVYPVDRFRSNASQSAKLTAQQNAGSVTPPAGFRNYLGMTSSSSYSVTSSDYFDIAQFIEGFNVADLMWGTASARPVTLSFWVRSSLTGTFGGSVTNSATNRAYVFSYTISAANTWEYKTITIAGDTSGTWETGNGQGILLFFGMGDGTSVSGTAGSWGSTFFRNVTGATSVVGTNGATFYLTGVQLEEGLQATSFEYLQYTTELAMCQRYFAKIQNDGTGGEVLIGTGLQSSTTDAWVYTKYPVTMRTEPTATISSLQLSNFRSFASDASLTAIYPGYDAGTIRCSMAASGATDAAIHLQIKNNTTGFLALSAEL
jgi:hypothetical protein